MYDIIAYVSKNECMKSMSHKNHSQLGRDIQQSSVLYLYGCLNVGMFMQEVSRIQRSRCSETCSLVNTVLLRGK